MVAHCNRNLGPLLRIDVFPSLSQTLSSLSSLENIGTEIYWAWGRNKNTSSLQVALSFFSLHVSRPDLFIGLNRTWQIATKRILYPLWARGKESKGKLIILHSAPPEFMAALFSFFFLKVWAKYTRVRSFGGKRHRTRKQEEEPCGFLPRKKASFFTERRRNGGDMQR